MPESGVKDQRRFLRKCAVGLRALGEVAQDENVVFTGARQIIPIPAATPGYYYIRQQNFKLELLMFEKRIRVRQIEKFGLETFYQKRVGPWKLVETRQNGDVVVRGFCYKRIELGEPLTILMTPTTFHEHSFASLCNGATWSSVSHGNKIFFSKKKIFFFFFLFSKNKS